MRHTQPDQSEVELALREAREAREALRQTEGRLRSLIERNADGIVIVDHDGTVMFVNPACEHLLGRPAARLLGEPFGFPCVAGSTAEIEILRPGGESAAAEMRVVETRWDGRPAFLATLRDITQRKSLEEQLRQSQKMEAIGRLAGGIAHDFNNILTAITGYTDLALSRLDGDGAAAHDPAVLRSDIQEIKDAAARATSVTRQLLTFSRKHLTQTEVFDVREVIAGMEGMLRRMLGDSVELAFLRGAGASRIKADRGQIEQVVLNLAINARDAMHPAGGRLTLGVCDVDDSATGPDAAGAPPGGPYVMISVTDTGRGIDSNLLPRIFEPFFTTKGPDRGTGLGLSIVYGIVQQCRGHVLVDSDPGRGTRFRIFLPRVGAEAMQLSTARGGPIQLLVTDVVMPGMSGRELAERLGPTRPEMKILFMSGFTRDEILPDGGEGTNTAFLQKPFTLEQLVSRVGEMVRGGPAAAPRGDTLPR
jgi:signal transduction histidine kinase